MSSVSLRLSMIWEGWNKLLLLHIASAIVQWGWFVIVLKEYAPICSTPFDYVGVGMLFLPLFFLGIFVCMEDSEALIFVFVSALCGFPPAFITYGWKIFATNSLGGVLAIVAGCLFLALIAKLLWDTAGELNLEAKDFLLSLLGFVVSTTIPMSILLIRT